jgi:hypothetical protein
MFNPPKWGPHAELEMIERGITLDQIAETWVYGELEPSEAQPGCWRLIGRDVTLVVSVDGCFIITMYPNKHKDSQAAVRVRNAISIGATRWED